MEALPPSPGDKPASARNPQPRHHLSESGRVTGLRPATTKPDNPNKNVPGFSSKQPLHRLYHDEKRRNANRSTAIATCVQRRGSNYATSDPADPRECDEFPFASTYEGAAHSQHNPSVPRDNYSAGPLSKTDNGAAGNILATFLDRNRIVDGFVDGQEETGYELDAYYVKIS